jgi:hypothetical protein
MPKIKPAVHKCPTASKARRDRVGCKNLWLSARTHQRLRATAFALGQDMQGLANDMLNRKITELAEGHTALRVILRQFPAPPGDDSAAPALAT